MRLSLDPDRCQGHGRCYGLAPELFDSDEAGHCVLLVTEVPPDTEAAAKDGVANCPEQALSIQS